MKRAILVGTLLAIGSVAFADSIDEAEAKKRGISVEAVQLERSTAQVAELRAKLNAAAATNAALSTENASLKKQLDEIKKKVQDLDQKLSRLTPSNDLPADGALEVTAAMLETVGERYVGKTVKMIAVRFNGADNEWVDELPGVTVASNGIVSRINPTERDKWIGFLGSDSTGKLFQRFFASKKDYADLIVGLKSGQKINLKGTVVALNQSGWYGFICTKIEVIPDSPPSTAKGR